jgi:hypothetical protein
VVEANTHLRLSKLRQSNSKKQGAAKAGVKTRAKKKLVSPHRTRTTARTPRTTAHARPHTLPPLGLTLTVGAGAQEVDQMDLEEKQLRERPKLTHIEAPGMRYITTETMERMTRVFPPTKV